MINKFSLHRKIVPGFMLVEILVVIAIIGLLATMVLAGVRYARQQADIEATRADIDTLYKSVGQLMIDTNEWPGHQTPEVVTASGGNEVWDLTADEAGIVGTDGLYVNWNGPYIKQELRNDPWGNPYFLDTDYSVNSNNEPCDGGTGCQQQPVIGSFGPDGLGQNLYNGDDIIRVIR